MNQTEWDDYLPKEFIGTIGAHVLKMQKTSMKAPIWPKKGITYTSKMLNFELNINYDGDF